MPIQFGTDGWRDIMNEGFSFDNVRFCAQGTASLLIAQGKSSRGLAIGYDTRLNSSEFAASVAEVSAGNDVVTFLCNKPAPTPALSYNLVNMDAGGGVVITASHNAKEWNGFKYKPDYGGSASQAIIDELERYIAKAESRGETRRITLSQGEKLGLIEYIDPETPYLSHLATLVDLNAIREAGLNIVVDSMFGSGSGYLAKLLEGGTTTVTEIHNEHNPAFPGIVQPEPIGQNLGDLITSVTTLSADVGLATDGDADRLGVVDETGRFITTLQTFALLCLHQLEVLGNRGPLVRSITMTSMVDRIGASYDVPVFDEPVGFKFLGPVMMRENALLAGEESGGYAFRGHIPERDGILSGLMFLEMMVKTGKSPSELLDMLIQKVGLQFYDRIDLEFDSDENDSIQEKIRNVRPESLGGRTIIQTDTRDGLRFILEGGFWALIRFSGTEPLLRIYAESGSQEEVDEILTEIRDLTGI